MSIFVREISRSLMKLLGLRKFLYSFQVYIHILVYIYKGFSLNFLHKRIVNQIFEAEISEIQYTFLSSCQGGNSLYIVYI